MVTSSDRSVPQLCRRQEATLVEDIIAAVTDPRHGSSYALFLPRSDCLNLLVLSLPLRNQKRAWIQVIFHEYPARTLTILSNHDLLNEMLCARMQYRLAYSSEVPLRLSSVLTHLYREGQMVQDVCAWVIGPAGAKLPAPALQIASSQEEGQEVTAPAPPTTALLPAALPRQVIVPEVLLTEILNDYRDYTRERRSPDEYAFICSGTLSLDGMVGVSRYYRGEMAVSTPVYCELTTACKQRILYHEVPLEHEVVVFGHIHPISGPSETDKRAFDTTAAWDYEVAMYGHLQKYSLAMLICSFTFEVSFYDTHTHERLPVVCIRDIHTNEGEFL
jgi:hypothetical protein